MLANQPVHVRFITIQCDGFSFARMAVRRDTPELLKPGDDRTECLQSLLATLDALDDSLCRIGVWKVVCDLIEGHDQHIGTHVLD